MGEKFDLLGDPIPEGWGKRGRPPHIPSQQNRNKIIVLLALGWTDARIANSLAITKPTLKKHYFRELKVRDQAKDRVDGVRVEMLWNAMREGNMAAHKEFGRIADLVARAFAAEEFDDDQEAPPAPRVGKKEAAAIEATTAGQGTGWGDDLLGPESGPTSH